MNSSTCLFAAIDHKGVGMYEAEEEGGEKCTTIYTRLLSNPCPNQSELCPSRK